MPDRAGPGDPQRLAAVLIAHRGEPLRFPENSLEGYRAALEAGARGVETDIQLSADGVPVLCHDAGLRRVTGRDIDVLTTAFARLRDVPAACPGSFGERFAGVRIATLEGFVALLRQWPGVRAFIEIKPQSFAAFGARAVDAVLAAIGPIAGRSVIISFEAEVAALARARAGLPVGWVLPRWSEACRAQAERLQPDFLFVNRKRLPGAPSPLWPGAWQWAVYTVNAPEQVPELLARGVELVVTDCVGAMLRAAPAADEPGG